jgi:hypothetical protein
MVSLLPLPVASKKKPGAMIGQLKPHHKKRVGIAAHPIWCLSGFYP